MPGAVVGLLLLIGAQFVSQQTSRMHASVGNAATVLLRYFPLFLVPVVAGIIDLHDLASGELVLLFLVSIAALFISLTITGLIAQACFSSFTWDRDPS